MIRFVESKNILKDKSTRAPFLLFYPRDRRRGKAGVFRSIWRHDLEEWHGVKRCRWSFVSKSANRERKNVEERRNYSETVPNGRAEFFFRREATAAAAAAATAFDPAKTAATSAEFLAESSILPSWPTAKQSRISHLSLSLHFILYPRRVTMLPIYCAD